MKIEIDKTCEACPEQYDVEIDGRQVGYMRLRNGRFTVECPDSVGVLVYECYPKGDGIFDTDERMYHLGRGIAALIEFHGEAP